MSLAATAARRPSPAVARPGYGRRIAAATAGAVLYAVAQSFTYTAFLCPLALLLLFVGLPRRGFLRTWASLSVFYVLATLLTTWWAHWTGPGADWVFLIMIPYLLAWTAGLAGALSLTGSRAARALVLVYLAPLAELAARHLLFGVTWTLQGQPLVEFPLISQLPALAGPESLSVLALALGAGLWAAFQPGFGPGRWLVAGHGALLLVGALAFGAFHWFSAPREPRTVPVAVVQPVISQRTRWTAENRGPMLGRLAELVDRAGASGPALIVLPEGGIPGQVRFDPVLAEFVKNAVRRTRTALLFGSTEREGSPPAFYNAAILISPFGQVSLYKKMRLVPFVEYSPFGIGLWDDFPDFTPGREASVISYAGVRFATPICFEDTLPQLARDFASNGAEALIALVNTEHFTRTPQLLQHLRRARLTAITAGMPMVRAANSGVSAVLDSRGRVRGQLPRGEPGVGVFALPLDAAATPARRMGDGPVAVLFALCAGAALLADRHRRYSSAR